MMSVFNHPLRLLFSGFCVLAAVTTAAASNEIRKIVTTEKETLSLADLIVGKNIPDIPIFRAPLPGENGTIKVARVVSAAQKLSVEVDETTKFDEVTISRKSRFVTEGDIYTALRREMAQISGSQKFDFTLIFGDQPVERHIESTAAGQLEIRSLKIDRRKSEFQAIAVISDSAILLKRPIELKGTVNPLQLTYIATKDIERGTVIGESDFREEFEPVAAIEKSHMTSTTSPRGMVLNRNLKAGESIPINELVAEIQVEKNGNALVRYERAGLMISMRGKALQSGSMGDVISVLNPQSKRTVDAIVTGKGRVTVKADASTNLAANTQ